MQQSKLHPCGPGRRWPLAVLFATVALAACGGKDEPAPATPAAPAGTVAQAPATPAAPAAPVVEQMSVDELLKNASLSVNEERLVAPAGNNAIEFYLAVLAQEPNNPSATQALVDIFPLAASIAEREISQRRIDEADRIVGLLDRASPGSYTVTTIRAKIDGLRQQQQRETSAQEVAQQQAAAAAAQAAAEAAAASAPATPAPAPAPASAPAQPVAAPAQPEPAPVVAAPAPTPAPSGETRDARVVRQVPPEYPTQAMRKRQTGWVELDFVIGADGRVSEVSVARANPPRVFDREAVRAMQQWTFDPALQNGQPVQSRGRRRIEFQL